MAKGRGGVRHGRRWRVGALSADELREGQCEMPVRMCTAIVWSSELEHFVLFNLLEGTLCMTSLKKTLWGV